MTDPSLDDLARRLSSSRARPGTARCPRLRRGRAEEAPASAAPAPAGAPAPARGGRRLAGRCWRPGVAAGLLCPATTTERSGPGGRRCGSSSARRRARRRAPPAWPSSSLRAGGGATCALSGLPPSSDGDFYELWLLGDDGELVSLGSFRVPASGAGRARACLLPVDPARFRFLDVSREPADGDPAHSSDLGAARADGVRGRAAGLYEPRVVERRPRSLPLQPRRARRPERQPHDHLRLVVVLVRLVDPVLGSAMWT